MFGSCRIQARIFSFAGQSSTGDFRSLVDSFTENSRMERRVPRDFCRGKTVCRQQGVPRVSTIVRDLKTAVHGEHVLEVAGRDRATATDSTRRSRLNRSLLNRSRRACPGRGRSAVWKTSSSHRHSANPRTHRLRDWNQTPADPDRQG